MLEVVLGGEKLKLEGALATDGDDGWPVLRAVSPSAGGKVQWLLVHGMVSGLPDASCCLVGLRRGRLERMASCKGVDIKVPGNGTVLTSAWVGFWSPLVKWSVEADGKLRFVPQEFPSVGAAKVKVKRSFALFERQGGDAVVARPREGSGIDIVLWKGERPATESRQLPPSELEKTYREPGWTSGWYLVRTESGLLGWVGGKELSESLELPMAG